MTVATSTEGVTALPPPTGRLTRLRRRHGWLAGVAVLLAALLSWRVSQVPEFGGFEVRTITAATLPLAFLAMAQALVVISGGIDLSVGAMMVLANCIAARLMEDQPLVTCLLLSLLVLAITVTVSALIGLVIAVSGIPDIIVTLAASFTLAGVALLVLPGPGGGTSLDFQTLLTGGFTEPLPSLVVVTVALALVWLPLRRSRLGSAIYAIGSDRTAAYLAGVRVRRTRVLAYAVAGVFTGSAGLVTTAFTGSGEPRAAIGSIATLSSVAAVVLGGVALTGGIGGLLGPVLAAYCLTLIPPLMLGLGWDPNYAEVARGVILIAVVLVGGLIQSKRRTT